MLRPNPTPYAGARSQLGASYRSRICQYSSAPAPRSTDRFLICRKRPIDSWHLRRASDWAGAFARSFPPTNKRPEVPGVSMFAPKGSVSGIKTDASPSSLPGLRHSAQSGRRRAAQEQGQPCFEFTVDVGSAGKSMSDLVEERAKE